MPKYAGFGTKFQLDVLTVFTEVAHGVTLGGPSMTVGTTDSTTHDSTWEEHLPTIPAGGQLTLSAYLDPVLAAHQMLTDLVATPAVSNWKLILPDAANTTWSFSGILNAFAINGMAIQETLGFDVGIQLSGAVTLPT